MKLLAPNPIMGLGVLGCSRSLLLHLTFAIGKMPNMPVPKVRQLVALNSKTSSSEDFSSAKFGMFPLFLQSFVGMIIGGTTIPIKDC